MNELEATNIANEYLRELENSPNLKSDESSVQLKLGRKATSLRFFVFEVVPYDGTVYGLSPIGISKGSGKVYMSKSFCLEFDDDISALGKCIRVFRRVLYPL